MRMIVVVLPCAGESERGGNLGEVEEAEEGQIQIYRKGMLRYMGPSDFTIRI